MIIVNIFTANHLHVGKRAHIKVQGEIIKLKSSTTTTTTTTKSIKLQIA